MKVEVCVGMIASGKSTYCKYKAERGWIVINDDSIVTSVHGGNYKLYHEAFKPLYKSVEDHILHTCIGMGTNVVIDRGLDISVEARQRWISIANSCNVDIDAVVFPMVDPLFHAECRFRSDNRGLSLGTWERIALAHKKKYSWPTKQEGFHAVFELSHWHPDGHPVFKTH